MPGVQCVKLADIRRSCVRCLNPRYMLKKVVLNEVLLMHDDLCALESVIGTKVFERAQCSAPRFATVEPTPF